MSLVYIQFGDFLETLQRFQDGGGETYMAQRYSVDYVVEQARTLAVRGDSAVTVISLEAASAYDEMPSPGLRVMGIDYYGGEKKALFRALSALKPRAVILRTPIVPVMFWCWLKGVKMLPLLADSFAGDAPTFKNRVKHAAMRFVLNRKMFPTIANHNFAASRDLARLGVLPDKIVPWDWPSVAAPDSFSAKTLGQAGTAGSAPLTLLYVGAVHKDKGVFDIVEAVKQAKAHVQVSIAGSGPALEDLRAAIAHAGLEDQISLLGRVAHTDVLKLMRSHDYVLVPSHHAFAEGLPCVIYEALSMRTPVILSDHPMFLEYLSDGEGVRIVPERRPDALAGLIDSTAAGAEDYAHLSRTTPLAFAKVFCPNVWHDVIDHWLAGDKDGWLKAHSLAAHDADIAARDAEAGATNPAGMAAAASKATAQQPAAEAAPTAARAAQR